MASLPRAAAVSVPGGRPTSRRTLYRLIAACGVAGLALTLVGGLTIFRPYLEEPALSRLAVRIDLPAGTLDSEIPGQATFILVVGSDRRVGLPTDHMEGTDETAGQRADALE